MLNIMSFVWGGGGAVKQITEEETHYTLCVITKDAFLACFTLVVGDCIIIVIGLCDAE